MGEQNDRLAPESGPRSVTRLAPVDTWPDVRLVLRPLPWGWRVRPDLYVDDVDGWKGHCSFQWLFLTVEWWGNKRLFTELVQP